MSDLVERAERAHKWAVAEDDHIEPELVAELVAELTRLREQCEAKDAEIERWQRDNDIAYKQIAETARSWDEESTKLRAEIERLKAKMGGIKKKAIRAANTVIECLGATNSNDSASLSAENERLRKALEASDKLITNAQEKLCAYLHPDSGIDERQIANEMLEHFDGPRQREVQKQTREALAAHVGEEKCS